MSENYEDDLLDREFDFKGARPNPYAKELKKQITINISPLVINYFKEESSKTGIPYQSLINLYLIDCVKNKKKLNMTWE